MFKDLYREKMKQIEEIEEEIVTAIQEEYDLSESGAREIISDFADLVTDILGVYNSWQECSKEEAFSLGFATKENEEWFDFDKFQESLEESGSYVELSTGEVLYIVQ